MRKLKFIVHMSLDGVIQNTNDGDNFPYGDWSAPYRTPAGRELIIAAYGSAFDLLIGRRTYDMWSGFWPKAPSSPLAKGLNAATKYVVTHSTEGMAWGPSRAIGGNIIEGVRQVKFSEGPDLFLSGSSTITSPLLEHGLVDEVLLITYPVLLGTGKRLFAESTPARSFELLSSKALPTGIVVNSYKFVGPLKTA